MVLAGGKSTRFGSDKASALLAGKPMLQWVLSAIEQVCSEVIVVAAQGQVLPEVASGAPLRVVRDRYEAAGPLAGMVTAFEDPPADVCLVVSCDAPLLAPDLLQHLVERIGEAAVACPEVAGQLQPLVAAYRPAACLAPFRAAVERGERGVLRALRELDGVVVLSEDEVRRFDPELRSFAGVNTPAELARAEALVAARRKP